MRAASEFEVLRLILLNQAQILNALAGLHQNEKLKETLVEQCNKTLDFVKEREW